jgi:hypothetical protein
MFTQPIMYQAIKRHKNALTIYQEKLAKEGSVPKEQVGSSSLAFTAVFLLSHVCGAGAIYQTKVAKEGSGAQGAGGLGGWAAFSCCLFGGVGALTVHSWPRRSRCPRSRWAGPSVLAFFSCFLL